MHPSVSRPLCVATLAAGVLTALQSGAETRPAAPDIAPAKVIKFTPQAGTAWYVDGSHDGVSWSELAGPFFASGGEVEYFKRAGDGSQRFKLRYVDPATVGSAPVTVAGTSVLMETAGEPAEVVFMDGTRGFLRIDAQHARSFTYTWLKKSPNEGEAILSGLDGTFTLLRLKFMDGQLGRWGMEDIPSAQAASLIKETLDAGAFAFRQGRFHRGLEHAKLPSDLAGSSMVLNEAGRLTHLQFSGASSMAMMTEGGTRVEGQYAYDPTDTLRGTLRLNPLNGAGLDLSLDLQAPGSGRFEEVLSGDGAGPRSGTFTQPEDQVPPEDADCPPKDLAGLTFAINDNSLCILIFNGDGTGVQKKDVNGALEATPFRYSYSRTGGNSASVAVTYPGAGNDLIDDYDLDFDDDCNGSFERQSYAGGNSRSQGTGTFGPGGLAGR